MFESKLRVNTSSKRVASTTKRYLERKFGLTYDYAVSSRNHLMLDFDCKGEKTTCFTEVRMICILYRKEFPAHYSVYETPNGFHVISTTEYTWRDVRKILESLLLGIKDGIWHYLDDKYIEACLRRRYCTLRLNQLRKVAEYSVGDILWEAQEYAI